MIDELIRCFDPDLLAENESGDEIGDESTAGDDTVEDSLEPEGDVLQEIIVRQGESWTVEVFLRRVVVFIDVGGGVIHLEPGG